MTYETSIDMKSGEPVAVPLDADTPPSANAAPRRSRRMLVAVLVALALVIGLVVWYLAASGNEAAAEPDRQVPTVSIVVPGRATVAGEVTATGTLAARRDVPVGAVGEGGLVVAVAVEEGSWVRQGQVLAAIDRSVQSQQAASASAQIQVAQADANLAQANLDRALKLVDRGFVSTADVDRLRATRDAANARVRVAQASLRELQARNARLNVVAPASGLVLERAVEPGQVVGGGSPPLFRIARGGEIELLARLGEAELARINAGVPAEVTPVGSDRSFAGRVWQVAPTIDATDRQGTARIALSYAPELRPGGFATAVIRSGTTVAPVLPESAIMSDDAGSYVYIVDGEDKVARRPVRLGRVTENGIVIAQGLGGRERVVLRAGGFLNPGETVKAVAAR